MVVPRSAQLVASDSEFTLYAVAAFKKHSAEFVHKCREQKWIPRDFKYVEGGKEEERKEVERVGGDERKVWGETLRLGRTAWSEAVMVWIHILVLRVFVETVLRYGLPLDFVCALVRVCSLCSTSRWAFTGAMADFPFYRHKLPSKQTAQSRTSRINTRTWRAMPLGGTRRAVCSGMILARCTQVVRAAQTTRRMCFMNSGSTKIAYFARHDRYKVSRRRCVHIPLLVHLAQTSIGYFCFCFQ
jgi:hypothetical protein